MDKIKVLQLVRPAEGGMKEHVFNLIGGLNKEKFSVHLFAPTEICQELNNNSIRTVPFEIKEGINISCDYKLVRTLSRYLREQQIQILHTHGVKAGLIGRLAAFFTKIPVTICTFHNLVYDRSYSRWRKRLYIWGNQILNRKTDLIIAVSKAIKMQLIKTEKIPEEKIEVIYNGIPLDKFQILTDVKRKKKSLGLNIELPVIGMVGRFVPEKGVDLFLDSAAIICEETDNIQFLIIGDGPDFSKIKDKCQQLGLINQVKFAGFRKDVAEILPILSVLVIPSRSEGLSLVALEGMACRRPIVAFSAGALPEIIIPCQNGFLVNEQATSELADAILFVLKNHQIAARVGRNAARYVHSYFTIDRMIKETEAKYIREIMRRALNCAEGTNAVSKNIKN